MVQKTVKKNHAKYFVKIIFYRCFIFPIKFRKKVVKSYVAFIIISIKITRPNRISVVITNYDCSVCFSLNISITIIISYIFNLTKKWDLDGSVEWNPARLINHSCEPNCEAIQEGKRIYIQALRDIETDEEITFDYGFDVESYKDHPCLCGSAKCVGYIVGKDYLEELAEKLAGEDEEE